MDKTKEKESEFGLKNTRLRMLAMAGESIAEGNNSTCRLWLLNYIDSISRESEPGKELMAEYTKLTEKYNENANEMHYIYEQSSRGLDYDNITHGIPATEWLDIESKKAMSLYVRSVHSLCWNIGNQWDLIPKE